VIFCFVDIGGIAYNQGLKLFFTSIVLWANIK